MGVLGNLARALKSGLSGKRTWTPAEVRELIGARKLHEARAAAEMLSDRLEKRDAERACLIGEISFQERKDEDADEAFALALREDPGMAAAHHGLSLLLAERGNFAEAVRHSFFAHSVQPNDPRFLAQLGYCNLNLKNFSLAEGPLRRATLLAPNDSYAWNNLGIVLRLKGAMVEARDCFQRAASLRPDDQKAADNLAQIEAEISSTPHAVAEQALLGGLSNTADSPALEAVAQAERAGRLQDAIDLCEELALELDPQDFPILELNRLYQRAGDPQSGIDALEAYLSRHPGVPSVVAALGFAKLEMRELVAAEVLLKEALERDPESPQLLLALGRAIAQQERFVDAAPWLEKAAQAAPADVMARAHLAANLVNQCRYEEGLAACEALRQEGLQIPALGMVLAYMGRFEEALEVLDEHIQNHPNDPSVRFHRAAVRLLRQDFEHGWEDYAYRGFSMTENFRVLPFPLWHGQPLEGKKIVVLAEQGLGDQVMFASCLPDLLALGPREVVVEVMRRIAPTLQRSFPQCRVIATSQGRKLEWVKDCPDMDYYVPLGDLPGHFRRSLAQFPVHDGYLRPDPQRRVHWRRQLEATGPGPYIGFSWKGGTESTRTSVRSMSAMSFKPLKESLPATWVCLQYGPVQQQVDEARAQGFDMAYWAESIADLDEFAALVGALDLVVTVCNTTVHYAGALAKPVWILAPTVPEWRYGVGNDRLPWYPTSRIFRQATAGAWDSALDAVRHELSSSGVPT